ncbi:MAG TPA: YMGG-like glycine zipper-containing protein [Pyrinomonadaceae bacterium]|jgi:hypothetical protein
MYKLKYIVALLLVSALLSINVSTLAQKRRQTAPSRRRTPAPARNINPTDSRLTGAYRLDTASSEDPREAAERAAGEMAFGMEQRDLDTLIQRLTSPERLAIERVGNNISIASSRAPRITFEADGRERIERASDGHEVRTRAVLYNDQLMVSSNGSRDDEFSVSFDSIDNGRRLRVTRRIYDEQLGRQVIVQSIYNKVSSVAQWNVYGAPETAPTVAARNNPRSARVSARNNRSQPAPQPPPTVATNRAPQPQPRVNYPERNTSVFTIGRGTQFVAVLNNNLSTQQSREGDPFTMTVRQPSIFEGATLEGRVHSINRSGPFTGRAEISLSFERITLRDGRTADFTGFIESVRTANGEEVRVDNEGGGNVQENDSQGNRTAQRVAIGSAVGAIIGAIAGGGKGAAIGAAIGAGAGAGSVYIQGRDELELRSGTEVIIRANGTG